MSKSEGRVGKWKLYFQTTVEDVSGLSEECFLTHYTSQKQEAAKTEEEQRTEGKAKEPVSYCVKYSIVKERRQGWQWFCLYLSPCLCWHIRYPAILASRGFSYLNLRFSRSVKTWSPFFHCPRRHTSIIAIGSCKCVHSDSHNWHLLSQSITFLPKILDMYFSGNMG